MNFYYEFVEFNSEIPIKSFIVGINEFAPHLHDELEIVFVVKGCINITISNETFPLNRNDFIIINSKEVHYFNKEDTGNIVLIIQLNPNIPVMPHSNLGLVRFQCNSINSSGSNVAKAIADIRNNLVHLTKNSKE